VQRECLARQPWTGLGGVLLAAVAFVVFAFGGGGVEASLVLFGPLVNFALPVIAVVAFWWNDWPASRLATPWTGLVNTIMVGAAAVLLTVLGQGVVGRFDFQGVFHGSAFPATLPLGGAIFTVMLQLTLVCERWPLSGGRLWSGVAALGISWAVGAGAYFLLVHRDAGLHNPFAAADFGALLLSIGVWQALFFIALRGWPVNTIGRRWVRLLTGNVLVLGLGVGTHVVLRDVVRWEPATVSAACGCLITGALFVSVLFDGWPAAHLRPAPGRVVTLGLVAGIAWALHLGLTAYAATVPWTRVEPADWVTTAAVAFLGAGIILHVGIGLRWPFV
jgi:hypothetical protein